MSNMDIATKREGDHPDSFCHRVHRVRVVVEGTEVNKSLRRFWLLIPPTCSSIAELESLVKKRVCSQWTKSAKVCLSVGDFTLPPDESIEVLKETDIIIASIEKGKSIKRKRGSSVANNPVKKMKTKEGKGKPITRKKEKVSKASLLTKTSVEKIKATQKKEKRKKSAVSVKKASKPLAKTEKKAPRLKSGTEKGKRKVQSTSSSEASSDSSDSESESSEEDSKSKPAARVRKAKLGKTVPKKKKQGCFEGLKRQSSKMSSSDEDSSSSESDITESKAPSKSSKRQSSKASSSDEDSSSSESDSTETKAPSKSSKEKSSDSSEGESSSSESTSKIKMKNIVKSTTEAKKKSSESSSSDEESSSSDEESRSKQENCKKHIPGERISNAASNNATPRGAGRGMVLPPNQTNKSPGKGRGRGRGPQLNDPFQRMREWSAQQNAISRGRGLRTERGAKRGRGRGRGQVQTPNNVNQENSTKNQQKKKVTEEEDQAPSFRKVKRPYSVIAAVSSRKEDGEIEENSNVGSQAIYDEVPFWPSNALPQVDDEIAYKMIQLNPETFTPEESEYQQAKIKGFQDGQVTLKGTDGESKQDWQSLSGVRLISGPTQVATSKHTGAGQLENGESFDESEHDLLSEFSKDLADKRKAFEKTT